MTPQEDDLRDFFSELRAEDEQTAAPLFTGLPRRKPRIKIWQLATPLGAAATILLLFLLYRPSPDATAATSPTNVLVISLEASEDPGTESLLSITDPVSTWESPSASLIADF
ncbi:hypothetical protein [Neolewinella persica]|uniref:hypothetical protein n=1 Tax=Neolewinella persica TaxID=70998 RepID=UPI000381C416|nr:hypothetical protein [Neolewinella persica]